MNKRRMLQVIAFLIIMVFVFQAGVFAYAKVASTSKEGLEDSVGSSSTVLQSEVVQRTYDQFLKEFDVQEAYRKQIEQLVEGGYSRTDVSIAYDFLYQNFGTIDDWNEMLEAKATGKTWEDLFIQYDVKHPEFIPRNFDSGELEILMQIEGATPDDIMIADRLSFVTGKPFGDLLNEKLKAGQWGNIFVRESVLYSGNSFPRVQLTEEEVYKYIQNGLLSEQQVTHAFVLAQKLGESPKVVISKLEQGISEELIMAQSYMEKYGE
ncbi:hypothetical protein J7E73_18180 [Paenibacillus albidus]|uniref:hypothetical protein n=1 Tax=Paenibacillus albidus TaxID=2041023 RepID=UPI001BEB84E9|nr:hypothetical protein [Paenibacillus albidus]MBT2291030.1 hypothetical protein [Paenibacillus albidus]